MNRIHETAVIGVDVVLGDGNVIGPFSVILGPCIIGNDNWIGPHVSLGGSPEIRDAFHHVSWSGENSTASLSIGDRNYFRDFSVVHSGSVRGTSIGNDNYIMNNSYIAHDTDVGDLVTISASSLIGGHCSIQSQATLGMGSVLHQWTVVGSLAMVGMGSVVTHHVEPFSLVYGCPARFHGLNRIGMQRAGYSNDLIDAIEDAYVSKSFETVVSFAPFQIQMYKDACSSSRRGM